MRLPHVAIAVEEPFVNDEAVGGQCTRMGKLAGSTGVGTGGATGSKCRSIVRTRGDELMGGVCVRR